MSRTRSVVRTIVTSALMCGLVQKRSNESGLLGPTGMGNMSTRR